MIALLLANKLRGVPRVDERRRSHPHAAGGKQGSRIAPLAALVLA